MSRNGTLILCYHRVAEGVEDPFHLCVHPDNFAAHPRRCRGHGNRRRLPMYWFRRVGREWS